MNSKIAKRDDSLVDRALPALRRAAKRARKIAEQTGTRLVIAPKAPARKASPKTRSAGK